jgi:hypothetical protein
MKPSIFPARVRGDVQRNAKSENKKSESGHDPSHAEDLPDKSHCGGARSLRESSMKSQ